MLIKIRMIQEMAITASLGVAVIILTDLVLVPVLLSYVNLDEKYEARLRTRASKMDHVWTVVAKVAAPRNAAIIVLIVAAALFVLGGWKATQIKIGDLHPGVPELRADSQYNIDTDFITKHFSIGVDVITVIVESEPEACTRHDIMTTIDRFEWHMRNVPGVQSVLGIGGVAKIINAGWNEGSLKWRVLPRNPSTMAQAVTYIDTSTGLLNSDCSVMPVYIYSQDHKAETIDRIVSAVKDYRDEHGSEEVKFRLATGNVGVMAATNETVSAAQFPMLMWIFAAIILLCLITFRSLRATLCIVIPLALGIGPRLCTDDDVSRSVSRSPPCRWSLSAWASASTTGSTSTPVAEHPGRGHGSAAGLSPDTQTHRQRRRLHRCHLALGVATWIFSPLKFQADMGILLTFMFFVNMLGAIILLPALAHWLRPKA